MEERDSDGWKIAFFAFLILLIVGIGGVGWFLFTKSKTAILPPTSELTVETRQTTSVPTPTPPVNEEALIRQAVFTMTGLDETQAELQITQNTGTHANGTIRELEAVGGAYWLAAKSEGNWVGVYDGQSQPTCTEIAPYNFPTVLVPQCLDAGGNVTTR